MQDYTWSFAADISSVYGYGLARESDTLTLEVYFIDNRPRLVLELFHTNCSGKSCNPPAALSPGFESKANRSPRVPLRVSYSWHGKGKGGLARDDTTLCLRARRPMYGPWGRGSRGRCWGLRGHPREGVWRTRSASSRAMRTRSSAPSHAWILFTSPVGGSSCSRGPRGR
jgi:hypothetical protein